MEVNRSFRLWINVLQAMSRNENRLSQEAEEMLQSWFDSHDDFVDWIKTITPSPAFEEAWRLQVLKCRLLE